MSKINKVLYNVDQTSDTTAAERRVARKNIGLDDILGVASTTYDTGIAPLGENGLVPARYLPLASADSSSTPTVYTPGLMRGQDKEKLDGLLIFSSVTDGSETITANSSSAALSLVAGSNISITLDPADREITIGATSSVSYIGFDTPQDPYPHNKAMTLNDYRYTLGSYITLEGVNDYEGQNDSRRFYLAPGRFTIGYASYCIDDILTQIPDYDTTDYNLRVLGLAKNSGELGYNQPGPSWMTVPGQIRQVQITDDTRLNKARNYLLTTNWLPYTIFDANRDVMCYPSRCYANGDSEKHLDFIGIDNRGGHVVICADEYQFHQGFSHTQAVYKVYDTDISGVYGQAANTIYFL